jgi:hypothetical protein
VFKETGRTKFDSKGFEWHGDISIGAWFTGDKGGG